MTENSIIFPNLHITLQNVGKNISIGSFSIAFYGMIIGLGMMLAMLVITTIAKKEGRKEDDFLDVTLIAIIAGIIGARLYYVIFSWDLYKDDLINIFNLRNGGLGIYGGVIVGSIAVIIVCKIKKIPVLAAFDILFVGVIIGQIMGRWGNFFNREAFGDYTNGLFAMQLPISALRSASDLTENMMANIQTIDGVQFVSVHPTFLYESLWNLMILCIMLFATKHKRFEGQVFTIYAMGYGLGRFIIEALRTDQLKIWGTDIAISRVVALVMISIGACITIIKLRTEKK